MNARGRLEFVVCRIATAIATYLPQSWFWRAGPLILLPPLTSNDVQVQAADYEIRRQVFGRVGAHIRLVAKALPDDEAERLEFTLTALLAWMRIQTAVEFWRGAADWTLNQFVEAAAASWPAPAEEPRAAPTPAEGTQTAPTPAEEPQAAPTPAEAECAKAPHAAPGFLGQIHTNRARPTDDLVATPRPSPASQPSPPATPQPAPVAARRRPEVVLPGDDGGQRTNHGPPPAFIPREALQAPEDGRLAVDPIPKPCAPIRLDALVSSTAWDRLTATAAARSNHRCEGCGARDKQLACWPDWEFDDGRRVQTLTGFAAICGECRDAVKLVDLDSDLSVQEAVRWLSEVNNWNDDRAEQYWDGVVKLAAWRDEQQWCIDLTHLEQAGVIVEPEAIENAFHYASDT